MAQGRRGVTPTEGTITSLASRGSQGERVVVWLDGRRAFDISAAVADEYGVRKSSHLDEEQTRELLEKDEPYRARDRALRLLASRDLSGGELVSKLLAAGISRGGAEGVLEWLQEQGYVDDLRYATSCVSDRTKAGWGRRRVMAELARKGLDPEVAKKAWEAWADEHMGPDEEQALVALVKRHFGDRMSSEPEATRRRAGAFLERRGHDWELIARVLKAAASEKSGTPQQ